MSRPLLTWDQQVAPAGVGPGQAACAQDLPRDAEIKPSAARPYQGQNQAFMLRRPGAGSGAGAWTGRAAQLIINQFWKIGSEHREEGAGKNLENWNTSGNYGGLYSGISNGLNTPSGLNGSGTKSWEYFILLWQEHDLLNRQPFLLWNISQHKQMDAEIYPLYLRSHELQDILKIMLESWKIMLKCLVWGRNYLLIVAAPGAETDNTEEDSGPNSEQPQVRLTSYKLQCMIMRRICSDILTPGLNRPRNL